MSLRLTFFLVGRHSGFLTFRLRFRLIKEGERADPAGKVGFLPIGYHKGLPIRMLIVRPNRHVLVLAGIVTLLHGGP